MSAPRADSVDVAIDNRQFLYMCVGDAVSKFFRHRIQLPPTLASSQNFPTKCFTLKLSLSTKISVIIGEIISGRFQELLYFHIEKELNNWGGIDGINEFLNSPIPEFDMPTTRDIDIGIIRSRILAQTKVYQKDIPSRVAGRQVNPDDVTKLHDLIAEELASLPDIDHISGNPLTPPGGYDFIPNVDLRDYHLLKYNRFVGEDGFGIRTYITLKFHLSAEEKCRLFTSGRKTKKYMKIEGGSFGAGDA